MRKDIAQLYKEHKIIYGNNAVSFRSFKARIKKGKSIAQAVNGTPRFMRPTKTKEIQENKPVQEIQVPASRIKALLQDITKITGGRYKSEYTDDFGYVKHTFGLFMAEKRIFRIIKVVGEIVWMSIGVFILLLILLSGFKVI